MGMEVMHRFCCLPLKNWSIQAFRVQLRKIPIHMAHSSSRSFSAATRLQFQLPRETTSTIQYTYLLVTSTTMCDVLIAMVSPLLPFSRSLKVSFCETF